jgi:hypothetical protein
MREIGHRPMVVRSKIGRHKAADTGAKRCSAQYPSSGPMRDAAENDPGVANAIAGHVERRGNRHQRELVARAIAHLQIPRMAGFSPPASDEQEQGQPRPRRARPPRATIPDEPLHGAEVASPDDRRSMTILLRDTEPEVDADDGAKARCFDRLRNAVDLLADISARGRRSRPAHDTNSRVDRLSREELRACGARCSLGHAQMIRQAAQLLITNRSRVNVNRSA